MRIVNVKMKMKLNEVKMKVNEELKCNAPKIP